MVIVLFQIHLPYLEQVWRYLGKIIFSGPLECISPPMFVNFFFLFLTVGFVGKINAAHLPAFKEDR